MKHQPQPLKICTSKSHPIILNKVPHKWPGSLYITFAPGKVQRNGSTAQWDRNLDMDLQRIQNEYEVSLLVCLLEKQQMDKLFISKLMQTCKKINLNTQWYPIPQFMVPEVQDNYKQLVSGVVDGYLRKGSNVVVVCQGGLGRGGTFAAACLIYEHVEPKQAIRIVRAARQNAINSPIQQQWLIEKLKF